MNTSYNAIQDQITKEIILQTNDVYYKVQIEVLDNNINELYYNTMVTAQNIN